MTCDQFWRARLRNEFVTRLTNTTSAGARVYPGRALPFDFLRDPDALSNLPAICVYTESADFQSPTGYGFSCTANVGVELFVTGADEPAAEAARDALANDVYHALLEEDLERSTIKSFGDDPLSLADGAVIVAAARLAFVVEFDLCLEPRADLDAFEEAAINVDQQIPDGVIDIAVVALPEQPEEP